MDESPCDCVLTLDLLLAHPEWADGFSVELAEGHGHQVRLPSVMAQIRGRARRCLVTVLMRQGDTAALLQALQQAFPHPQAAWWTTPLLGAGRFA